MQAGIRNDFKLQQIFRLVGNDAKFPFLENGNISKLGDEEGSVAHVFVRSTCNFEKHYTASSRCWTVSY